MNSPKLKVVMGNIGLDGHEMGALTVARGLRDAGMEVIYLGLCQTPDSIAQTAIQEDADIIGVSSMSGAHNELIPEIIRLLSEMGAKHVPVIAGGIIPRQDFPPLLQAGVSAIFGPGTPIRDIVDYVNSIDLSQKRGTHS